MSRPDTNPALAIALHLGLVMALINCAGLSSQGSCWEAAGGERVGRDVSGPLGPILQRYGIPAMSVAVVRGDTLLASGTAGVCRAGDSTAVSSAAPFHLGSCTKAMTATLAAILVSRSELSWDRTVAEAFPELADSLRSEYHPVTLVQLLRHRSGLPADRSPTPLLLKLRSLGGSLPQQRLELVRLAFGQEPVAAPGTRTVYSNYGYVVAAAMLERATGESWEALMRRELFGPLGMTSAGFGPPAAGEGAVGLEGEAGACVPWGHHLLGDSLRPVPPGPLADNPPVLAPAGTVHASVGDWACFAALHLRGARGGSDLLGLDAGGFAALHNPPPESDYAMGWQVVPRPWAGGDAIMHVGSNGMWYAIIWMAPERDIAFLVVANAPPRTAAVAADEAVGALIRQFLQ